MSVKLSGFYGEKDKVSPLSELPVPCSWSPSVLGLISSSWAFWLLLALLFVISRVIISPSSVFTERAPSFGGGGDALFGPKS